MKSDIPEVGTRMSYICTNLHEIAKTDSGHVLSKAQKVSGKTCTAVSLITPQLPFGQSTMIIIKPPLSSQSPPIYPTICFVVLNKQ